MCEKNATKKCIVDHVIMDVLNSLIYSAVFYAFLSFVKPWFLCENGDRESDFLQYSPANGVWLSRESLTFCFGLIVVFFFGGPWFETSGTRRKTRDLPLRGPTTQFPKAGTTTNVNVMKRDIFRPHYSELSGEDVSSAISDSSSEASSTSSASYASVASSKVSSKASWLSNESHESASTSAVPAADALLASTSFEDTTASTALPPTNKKTKEEIMQHLQNAMKQNGPQAVRNAIPPNASASAPNPYGMPVLTEFY